MFILAIEYVRPLNEVDARLEAHRAWVAEGYEAGVFLASGPKVPRTGGVILCHGEDRAAVEARVARDPFVVSGVARTEITEMDATRVDPRLAFLK